MRIIGIIIIIGMVVGAVSTIDYKMFIDLPSMLIVDWRFSWLCFSKRKIK